MNLRPGTTLQNGKYNISRILGKGGFGITYLGTQEGLNRKVAIKEFFMEDYCERDSDSTIVTTIGTQNTRHTVETFRNKFKKEAQNIASLNHPGIVKVYDVFEENNTVYYVMEYLSGGSLKDKLDREGALTSEQTKKYLMQVADALDYMHHSQVEVEGGVTSSMLHLDVKPANIMLNTQGRAVLVDFGLSKRYDESGNQTSDSPMGISEGYAPLEQYDNGGIEQFTAATDIYALGATGYHMLTGKRPPKASDVMNKGIPELPKSIPGDLVKAVRKAMNPVRKERPQDIEAFLKLFKSSTVVISRKAMIAAAVAIILLVIGYIAYNNHTKPRELYDKAMTYVQGDDSDKWNVNEAVRLMTEAAEMGYTEAQYQLGLFYYLDEYDIDEEEDAIKWWLKAYENGYQKAGVALGAHYYDDGEEELAVKYLMPAAENGDADAQWMIAECYEEGEGGLPESAYKAFEWYQKSAAQGNANGQYNLGHSYIYGEGVETDEGKGVGFIIKAAEQGHSDAQFDLGTFYHNGRNVEKNLEKAKEWYSKALANEDYSAAYRIGSIYEEEKNYKDAFYMYSLGAKYNDRDCCWGLGYYYFHALGETEQDYKEAFKWFTKAAGRYHVSSQYYLGYMYKEGLGVDANRVKAVEWFMKAAEYSHPWATLEVAQCYENGEVLEKDILKALEYYKKIAKQKGNEEAAKRAEEHLERLGYQ